VLATGGSQRNLLVGGFGVAKNSRIVNNCLYFPSTGNDESLNLGYFDTGAGSLNGLVTGNYLSKRVAMQPPFDGLSMTGNTFFQPGPEGFTASQFPNNNYINSRPTGTIVVVRPNRYESGRANIAVYNWDSKSTVDADISAAGLASGDQFEVRDSQNFFGS